VLSKQTVLSDLKAGLLSLERAPVARPDKVRASAFTVASEVAFALDQYWLASSSTSDGPIDVIDMFSGSGGMSAGFRAFNRALPTYRIVAGIDIDEVANRTYYSNFGVAPHSDSVSLLSRMPGRLRELLDPYTRRDHPLVLIGCAPCQGFSSHRNGRTGDVRNSLFLDFAQIAAAIRPDAVVVENVPELLTETYWDYVHQARRLLSRAGYQVHLSVHDMAAFGVPQHRFRALLIATRHAVAPMESPLRRGSYRTVRQAIGHLPPIAAGKRCTGDPMHYTAAHRPSTLETIRAVPKDGGSRPPDVGPECLRRIARQGKPAYEDVYGRLFWDRPAITITAYARNPASGRFVHPDQDRGLSVREAALLQGFPNTYKFEGTLDECFRQIGNAVPPIFSSFLAGYLLGEMLSFDDRLLRHDAGITSPVGASFARMIPALKADRQARGTR
jgi:DNA (cytosine-5)-methyltransferase 1